MPTSQMDIANRAKCFILRNPSPGIKKIPFKTIIKKKLVKKQDETVPSQGAICEAERERERERERVREEESERVRE